MLDLPILNVRLSACPADWQLMTPTPQGRHCSSCNREVVDFTAATQADLDAARAAAPDGRLCGRFRTEQVALVQPQLRPKLRRFLVALVLVCGLGLTSGEAWAQVRKAVSRARPSPTAKPAVDTAPSNTQNATTGLVGGNSTMLPVTENKVYNYVEQMPIFPGGQEEMQAFLQKNLRWPKAGGRIDAEGRIFVNFIVGSDGRLREFKVLKGIHPLFDAEAVEAARLLEGKLVPGKQNGRAVDVYYTVPVTFLINHQIQIK